MWLLLAMRIEVEREQDGLIKRAKLLREQATFCEARARRLDGRIDALVVQIRRHYRNSALCRQTRDHNLIS